MTETTQKRVTLDDVKSVIASNPSATNVNKIRDILGYGSFQTIQKHLNTLRAAEFAEQSEQIVSVPTVPADAVNALWTLAYTTAQNLTLQQLQNITKERDSLLEAIENAEIKVETLEATLNELTTTNTELTTVNAHNIDKVNALTQQHEQAINALVTVHTANFDEYEAKVKQLEQQLEQATKEHESTVKLLHAELNGAKSTTLTLIDQLSDLKAVMYVKPELTSKTK